MKFSANKNNTHTRTCGVAHAHTHVNCDSHHTRSAFKVCTGAATTHLPRCNAPEHSMKTRQRTADLGCSILFSTTHKDECADTSHHKPTARTHPVSTNHTCGADHTHKKEKQQVSNTTMCHAPPNQAACVSVLPLAKPTSFIAVAGKASSNVCTPVVPNAELSVSPTPPHTLTPRMGHAAMSLVANVPGQHQPPPSFSTPRHHHSRSSANAPKKVSVLSSVARDNAGAITTASSRVNAHADTRDTAKSNTPQAAHCRHEEHCIESHSQSVSRHMPFGNPLVAVNGRYHRCTTPGSLDNVIPSHAAQRLWWHQSCCLFQRHIATHASPHKQDTPSRVLAANTNGRDTHTHTHTHGKTIALRKRDHGLP